MHHIPGLLNAMSMVKPPVLINYQIILLLTHLSQSIFGLAALPLTLHSAGLVYDALS
jgi:hypothetical protein